jgi:hypothetical protein
MTQVTSLEHLKELAKSERGEMQDFFISLAGGIARSSKRIYYDPDANTFDVFHEIDDTWEDDLTEEQLASHTNIVSAIEVGALYKY